MMNLTTQFNTTSTEFHQLIIWSLVTVLKCLLDILLSCCVILAFVRFKRLESGINFMLCNLAVSNILMDVFNSASSILLIFRYYHSIPEQWCIALAFFRIWFTFVGVMILASISVCQLVTIHRRYNNGHVSRVKVFVIFLAPCWIAPLITGVLTLSGTLGEYRELPPHLNYCEYGRQNRQLATWITVGLHVALPSITMLVCSGIMLYSLLHLRRVIRTLPKTSTHPETCVHVIPQYENVEKQSRTVWTIFLPFICLFSIFTTGFVLNRLNDNVIYQGNRLGLLWERFIYHSATSIVALLYVFTTRDLREGLRSLWFSRKLRPLPESHKRIAPS